MARRFTRRGALQAGAASAAAVGLSACSNDYEQRSARAGDAPNVILIITDSTRADYLGAYNARALARTPNLDALFRQALRFDYAVPEAMPTGLVRRTVLTGMRSFPNRDWVLSPPMPAEVGWTRPLPHQPLLTEELGKAGVETAYVTDNPFIVGPRYTGFRRTLDIGRPDFSQGAYRDFNTPFRRPAPRGAIEKYLLPALSDTVEVRRLQDYVGWNSLYRVGERNYSAARVMRGGMDALDELKDKQPFFLGVDSFDPHEPFDAPPVYVRRIEGQPKGVQAERGVLPIQPFLTPASRLSKIGIDDETLQLVRELYAAEITFVDRWIGKLLNKLDDLGLAENTVVYYLSDHGLTIGEHDIIGKSTPRPYREIHHIPYAIKDPTGRMAGRTSDYFASTHDVARTIMSFMGVRAPGLMDGDDLTVLFDGAQPTPRRYFTSCYQETWICGDGEWLMISTPDGARRELYNVVEDPGNTVNLGDEEERRDVDPNDMTSVVADPAHRAKIEELWQVLVDEAGGTLPVFHDKIGVVGG